MTGPKLNEKSYVAGERSGTKATAKYVRTSASKARAVLDLIRGLDVASADQVLQFTERHVAHDVRKVLASAVANAVNNDEQDAEELFVVACFADEGPTLRRFRPRARGRATRINKRTCHITVIVARMSDEQLEMLQAREERAGGAGRGRPSSAASRRARDERSRQRAAQEAAEEAPQVGDEVDDAVEEAAPSADTAEASGDETDSSELTSAADDESDIEAGQYPGSALPLEDGGAPEGYEIKGNEGSMLYHEPGSRYYPATKAEVWFDSVESAEAAGFSAPGAATKDDETDAAQSDEEHGTADEEDQQ
jgi:large subunit ribosomal protein L22